MTAKSKHPKPAEIKALRTRFGLTQREAANLVGIAYRTWQDQERGVYRMPAATWFAFKALLLLAAR